jgi:nucleotide-binding universal stress UspA family protein
VRQAVRFGNVVAEILGLLSTLDRPVLVLASREHRGIGRLFVGRVAPSLIRDATCPILTVRQPTRHAEGMPPLGRILVPLDLSRLAEHAVDTALDILGSDAVQIHLLHVASPIGTPAAQQRARSFADRYLRDQAARLTVYGCRVTTEVRAGDPAAEILRTAGAWGADLVSFTLHGSGGFKRLVFGSVAETILRLAQFPLLIARPENSGDDP